MVRGNGKASTTNRLRVVFDAIRELTSPQKHAVVLGRCATRKLRESRLNGLP